MGRAASYASCAPARSSVRRRRSPEAHKAVRLAQAVVDGAVDGQGRFVRLLRPGEVIEVRRRRSPRLFKAVRLAQAGVDGAVDGQGRFVRLLRPGEVIEVRSRRSPRLTRQFASPRRSSMAR